MRTTLDRFITAFNDNDLDAVMRFFADEAVYCPGDGSEHRGPAAIRRAFEPQFAGAFGSMRFDEHDRLVDESASKAAIRWTCRHDLAGAQGAGLALRLQRLLAGLFVGPRFSWEGVDVLHFNAAGLITGKYTYAGYTRPRLQKERAAPVPQRRFPTLPTVP
jgi:ketosteroid isomerase-like protein